ncbi:MAG: hypothetical protein DMH00_08940 [Acidobacteria bacterium]|nr:MAG: hypothetical protein DMH00_08940 [Acidobacteriota bacterium]
MRSPESQGLRAALLCFVAAAAGALGSPPAAASLVASDGYLSRRLEVMVYPADKEFETSARGLTLEREISLFEGYLWRYSLRHLSVEAHLNVVHRPLGGDEFRDYGDQFGYLLDRSPQVEKDLHDLGLAPGSLMLIYDPPADRPARLAGRTFFEGSHSSIPLRETYFQEDGFFRPLHLVMAHEYLHQIDLAFSRLGRPWEFLDPDGAGLPDYPSCIDPGGGDLSLRTLLQYNKDCQPVPWELLAPVYGIWVPR